jgi:hypothetical protein
MTMSNETRRAIDYLVGALRASVRDGQRAIETPDALYHVGVILRRMGNDVAALSTILRETQKDATPARRKRKRRASDELPRAATVHDSVLGVPWPVPVTMDGATIERKPRKPGRPRKVRNADPPAWASVSPASRPTDTPATTAKGE